MSDITTRGVRVRALSQYHAEQSDPAAGYWLFTYTITLSNEGDTPVQLVSRHWVITDATGSQEHVSGLGVVGEQPRLEPGAQYQYSSGCPLPTSMGAMHGHFEMVLDDGERFEAEIAPFTLADPMALN